MTIDEAIDILDTHQCDMPRNEVPVLIDAVELGIEALKFYRELHRIPGLTLQLHLPGETKE